MKSLRFKILKIHIFRCFYDLIDDITQVMLFFFFIYICNFFNLEYKTYLKAFFFCILATWHKVSCIRVAWNGTWSSIRNDLFIRSWLYSQGKTAFLLKKLFVLKVVCFLWKLLLVNSGKPVMGLEPTTT